jgi:hypothetical protein
MTSPGQARGSNFRIQTDNPFAAVTIDWGMSFIDRRYHPAAFARIQISLSEKYQSIDQLNFPDRMRMTSQILNKNTFKKWRQGIKQEKSMKRCS